MMTSDGPGYTTIKFLFMHSQARVVGYDQTTQVLAITLFMISFITIYHDKKVKG